MIAFVQPFGLNSPGGGARILRSLLGDAPVPFVSVCTSPQVPATFSEETEVHLPVRTHFGFVERTRLARYLSWVTLANAARFRDRLRTLFERKGVTAVHAIPHGLEFWHAFEVARDIGIPYVLNVHDDMTYNLSDSILLDHAMNKLAIVWRKADARIVISNAMGKEYCSRYGSRSFEIVTDGLEAVVAAPRPLEPNRLNVYFMGSTHLSYRANFQSLLDALNRIALQHPNWNVHLTIRGGVPFALSSDHVPIEALGWGTQQDIEQDLTRADMLYFPLPFDQAHDAFVRLSLSTKMVTYLGSGLPILYHGPQGSAAARMLDAHGAGLLICSLDDEKVASLLLDSDPKALETATLRGLSLAQSQFMLDDQRKRFWELVETTMTPPATRSVSKNPLDAPVRG